MFGSISAYFPEVTGTASMKDKSFFGKGNRDMYLSQKGRKFYLMKRELT